MHIDTDYVRDGGGWDVDGLFKIEEITDDVLNVLHAIPNQATSFRDLNNQAEYPPVDGEPPYCDPVIHSACKGREFAKHCSARVPADHIAYLGLHHSRSKKLLANGVRSIGDVPVSWAIHLALTTASNRHDFRTILANPGEISCESNHSISQTNCSLARW